jgi:hypothetical protein
MRMIIQRNADNLSLGTRSKSQYFDDRDDSVDEMEFMFNILQSNRIYVLIDETGS